MVPLLVALRGQGYVRAFVLSLLTGLGFVAGVFYWVTQAAAVQWSDFAILVFYFASYVGFFGLAFQWCSARTKLSPIVLVPILWVSLEYVRGSAGFLALPWALLGHSQYRHVAFIQVASLTGVYGVSFMVATVNAAVSELLIRSLTRSRPTPTVWPWVAAIPVLALGTSLVYGWHALSKGPPPSTVTVTVVQASIPQTTRWLPELHAEHLAQHVALTSEATSESRPALVVWPETAVAGYLQQDLRAVGAVFALARASGAHLLVGSSARPKFGRHEGSGVSRFNSALFVSPRGALVGQYNQVRLLPFAQYLPYKDFPGWPTRLVSAPANLAPGKEHTLFRLNDAARFGVTICWENIFPDVFRQSVSTGATFMVNIGNEAMFGDSAAPYQLLAMSVFRAVENRVALARSVNTGISGFIDPNGRLIGRVRRDGKDIFVPGHLTAAIPLSGRRTFYTTHGDVFADAIVVMAGLVLVASVVPRRTRGSA